MSFAAAVANCNGTKSFSSSTVVNQSSIFASRRLLIYQHNIQSFNCQKDLLCRPGKAANAGGVADAMLAYGVG
jgi:hypothetical protein